MKRSHITFCALCLLMGIQLSTVPVYAEPEEETVQNESEATAEVEEGSKEWKRAKLIACQKFTAEEFKSFRQLANLLKKAKGERDYKKANKMAGDLVKKYAPLYSENKPVTIDGLQITAEDLIPCHTKLGSQRRKLYKDFLEYCDKQSNMQNRSGWDNNVDDSKNSKKKKKKKKQDEAVSLNMGQLDTIKGFLRVNQEEFANKIDEEREEEEEENGKLPMR